MELIVQDVLCPGGHLVSDPIGLRFRYAMRLATLVAKIDRIWRTGLTLLQCHLHR